MPHGILTPNALSMVNKGAAHAVEMKVIVALPPDAVQAMIGEISALRALVIGLLPSNWDEDRDARRAIAHLRATCGHLVTEQMLLSAGLPAVDPEPEHRLPPATPAAKPDIIDPGDTEGGAP